MALMKRIVGEYMAKIPVNSAQKAKKELFQTFSSLANGPNK
ncbi:hypothetical protein AB996_0370 [Lactococcus cremoris]|uniref:Uncharacterized protein n=1 Tax=Lactococcus lactis subsp. cremoris TaxID=1359 RepID=A0A166K8C4_LACLC|nr:hypothetical protein AB996_0370 [Lactococcus cremoris]